MKIAIVFTATDEGDFGGMHRFISVMAKYFYDGGDQVVMIFPNKKFYYPCSGKVIELNSVIGEGLITKLFKSIIRCYKIRQALQSEKCDVIYNLYWLTPLFLIDQRKKIISSVHSNPFVFSPVWQLIVRKIFTLSRWIIVPSYSIAKLMQSKWDIKNVIGIHNPLDFDYIAKQMDCSKECSFPSLYILSAGRLVQEKNFRLLIAAYNESKIKDFVSLVIIGDGELKDELVNLRKELNLEGRVYLLGMQDNPFIFMKNCLFFVSSSLTEAFPLAIAEALACGAPVVSSNWFGVDELVNNGVNGLLVDYDNIDALAAGLDKMFFDEKLYYACKLEAKRTVMDLALDYVMRQYKRVFVDEAGA